MQSRCNGGIIEHKFSYCQGEDVAGERFTAESAEDTERKG